MTEADRSVSTARPTRRTFAAEYKKRILAEYAAATAHGARGALLRREGLYDSHIQKWRKAERAGRLDRQTAQSTSTTSRVRQLQAENERLRAELATTKAVLDVVGKARELLQAICESEDTKMPLTR